MEDRSLLKTFLTIKVAFMGYEIKDAWDMISMTEESTEVISQGTEKDLIASDISALSVKLEKDTDGRIPYSEDCYVFDIDDRGFDLEQFKKVLPYSVLREHVFTIIENKGKKFMICSPYDALGRHIGEHLKETENMLG